MLEGQSHASLLQIELRSVDGIGTVEGQHQQQVDLLGLGGLMRQGQRGERREKQGKKTGQKASSKTSP